MATLYTIVDAHTLSPLWRFSSVGIGSGASQAAADLKVLCITGYPLNVPEDLSEPTLYKPFSCEELLKKIQDVLE